MSFNYEYPYTDAQRYNDDWLINKVKELAMDWLKTSGEWTETQEAWEELKRYITDYFNNLDVQEEINEKLEAMKADGSLSNIIIPLFGEYQQAIDVLSARMDTFTSLPEGSTTGDAELADATVDYTGQKWSNVGDAIRGGDNKLSTEISKNSVLSEWAIQPNYIDNKIIYYFTGYSGTIDGNSITDFIEIPNGVKTIYIRKCKGPASGGDNRGSAFYSNNTEESYISGVQMLADNTEDIMLIVPNNAKYFRATITTPMKAYAKFYFNIAQTLLYSLEQRKEDVKPLYTSLSVFESFGVIGDSFASGEIYVNGQGKDYYNLSWGQILARQYGVECKNFSSGGLTTRTWLTSEVGLPNLLGSNARKIYYLALGINDYYSLGIDYLGSIADIKEDYTQNADTFYGNYGKIIGNIKTHAPNAKIVMFTIATLDGVAPQFSEAIINIANHFNIPYIVQRDDEYFLSDFYTSFVQGHPVAITYSGMAQAFARLMNKCMIDNYDYFKDYVG